MTNDKITVSRELLRQTIDLLDDMLAPGATFSTASLRAAVEQTAVEPVAYQYQDTDGKWCNFVGPRHYADTVADGCWPIHALYTAPQPQQSAPVQGPVPLLTDEEVSHIAVANAIEFHEFARAIEQAVRQKAGIK